MTDPEDVTLGEVHRVLLRVEDSLNRRMDDHEDDHRRSDERRASLLRAAVAACVALLVGALPFVVQAYNGPGR